MKGGERICSKCVHGPRDECRKADVREWFTTDYGARFCTEMERTSIASRAATAAKRMTCEWPDRKAVKR